MRITSIIVLMFLSFQIDAEGKKELEDLPDRWQEINLYGGINGNSYIEYEASYTRMFNRFFGLTGGLNAYLVFAEDRQYDYYTGKYENRLFEPKTIHFRPAVRFRFPIAYQEKTELLALNLEPGLYLPIGADDYSPSYVMETLGNKKERWCYLNLKAAITLNLCPLFISIGYMVTDFSHKNDPYRFSHTGFMQIGYVF